MSTPKDLAEFDQSLAELGDTTPSVVWELFSGFKRKGFSEDQSLELAKTWMIEAVRNAKRNLEQ